MDQKQYESVLADAELKLKRLRVLYDHWFHGIDRTEPQNQRLEVERMITSLRREPQRNTALRFRFNQLVQRYTTFNTYWQRISRQIEEGTYKRDLQRARRIQSPRGAAERGAGDGSFDGDVDVEIGDAEDELDQALSALNSAPPAQPAAPAFGSGGAASATASGGTTAKHSSAPPRDISPFAHPGAAPMPVLAPLPPPVRSSTGTPSIAPVPISGSLGPRINVPPPPPAAGMRRAPPPPPSIVRVASPPAAGPSASGTGSGPGSGNGISERQLEKLYTRYVEARRNNAERTDNVKLETIAKTVRDMLPKLQEKHAGKQIDFEVVVKDGRVALKPVAK